jgi:hypothetical protein
LRATASRQYSKRNAESSRASRFCAQIGTLRVHAKNAELDKAPFGSLEFPTREEIACDPLGAWDRLALVEQKVTSRGFTKTNCASRRCGGRCRSPIDDSRS